jgi:hypothetical protein
LPSELIDLSYDLEVNENGSATTSNTFTVSLTAPPLSDVTVSFELSSPALTIEPSVLVFDYQNYDLPRTVTVASAATEDFTDQGSGYAVTVSTTVQSADKIQDCKRAGRSFCGQAVAYDGYSVDDLTTHVVDDDTAGLAVSESSLEATFDNYGDAHSYAYFTVALTSQPAAEGSNVLVALHGVDDSYAVVSAQRAGEALFQAGTELNFTHANWNSSVTVAVAVGAPHTNRPMCDTGEGSTDGGHTCGILTAADGTLRYTLTFDTSGSGDATYGSLDTTPSSSGGGGPSVAITGSVLYDATEPPALVSAQFGDLLNSVTLKFDMDTDRARTHDLGPTFKCHNVLSLSAAEARTLFGANSECSFAKPDILKVVFGSGATLSLGDNIGITNHAVGQIAGSLLVSHCPISFMRTLLFLCVTPFSFFFLYRIE